jgi:hypothetical protein
MNAKARDGRQTAAGFYLWDMRHLIAAVLFIILALPARAEITRGADVLALTAGVICAPEAIGFRDAPDTILGRTHILDQMPPFAAETLTVPAVLGVGFGVRVQATEDMGTDPLIVTLTHPPMGEGGVQQQSFNSTISGLDPTMAFYQFDYPYELVTGQWTFEGHRGGDLVYRVIFSVVPPQAVPELAAICNYRDLLS